MHLLVKINALVVHFQCCIHREELTIYSACMNTQKGIYYYKTYSNNQISAVYLNRAELDGSKLETFELITSQQVRDIN